MACQGRGLRRIRLFLSRQSRCWPGNAAGWKSSGGNPSKRMGNRDSPETPFSGRAECPTSAPKMWRRYGPPRIALWLAAILGCAISAHSYLPMVDPSSGAVLKWTNNTTTYQISTNLSGSQFSSGDTDAIKAVISEAFLAWTSAPNTSLSISRSIAALPNPLIAADGHNVICFNCQDAAFTSASGSSTDTLAVTDIVYRVTSQGSYLYDTDMQFNPAVKFVLPPQRGPIMRPRTRAPTACRRLPRTRRVTFSASTTPPCCGR